MPSTETERTFDSSRYSEQEIHKGKTCGLMAKTQARFGRKVSFQMGLPVAFTAAALVWLWLRQVRARVA